MIREKGRERSNHKHLRLKEDILERIRKGEWQLGEKIPSRHEIVKKYKFSEHTYKTAVRTLIDEGVLEGIQGKGIFVRSFSPRSSIKRIVCLLGVSKETHQHPAFNETVNGIVSIVSETDFQLSLNFIKTDQLNEENILRRLTNDQPNGIILGYIPGFPESALDTFAERDVPIVAMGWELKNTKSHSVVDNLGETIHQVVAFFLSRKRRKIAYLGYPAPGLFEKRLIAFSRAYADYNVPIDLNLMLRGKEKSPEQGQELIKKLLDYTVPNAIIADDDAIYHGVRQELDKYPHHRESITVVRLGGWDPFLACPSIKIPFFEQGRQTAMVLKSLLDGDDVKARKVTVPCRVELEGFRKYLDQ